MTSLGHVTSSGACPYHSPWALSYWLSIGIIPQSGFVSEIFSPKVGTKIITTLTDYYVMTSSMTL